jgi:hypothetical protein
MDLRRRRRRARNRGDGAADDGRAAGAAGGGDAEEGSVGGSSREDQLPPDDDEEEPSAEEAQEAAAGADDGENDDDSSAVEEDGDGGGADSSAPSNDDDDDDDDDDADDGDEDSWDGDNSSDNDDDSFDSNDVPEEDRFVDELLAYTLEEMVDMLEMATGGARIERLRLHLYDFMEHWDEDRVLNYPDLFRRFVARLADPVFDLRRIDLTSVALRTDDGLRASDLERLFRDVLPHRPGLQSLQFLGCHISGQYLRLYTDALLGAATTTADSPLPSPPPLGELVLDFDGCGMEPLDPDCVAAISDLIRRNVPVRHVDVICRYPGLTEDNCRLLCGGVAHNTNLQQLTLMGGIYVAGTVDPAVGPSSSLVHLDLHGQLSNEGMASIAQQLKNNSNMEVLNFSGIDPGYDDAHFGMLVETMEHYNYTMLGVSEWYESRDLAVPDPPRVGPGSTIERCLRRNKRIGRALQAWPEYHVPSSTGLWSILFELVNQLPTLVYRFLRRRNVQALCDAAAAAVASRASSRTKRARR